MFLRNDSEAINAACRAFERSNEAKTGVSRWPGTAHIEAAVDAYLQARGIGDTGPAPAPQPAREIHNVRAEHGPWEIKGGDSSGGDATRIATIICDQCGVIQTMTGLHGMLDLTFVKQMEIYHNLLKLWEAHRV